MSNENQRKEKLLYTEAEAAEFLGFSYSSLKTSRYTNILSGVKPPAHVRIGTKSIRYRYDALVAWAEDNAVAGGSDDE